MTTKAEVLLIAPELSVITDDNVWTLILSDVANELDPLAFGIQYDVATRYLAAHLLTLARNIGGGAISPAAGVDTSESAGRVSVSRTMFASLLSDGLRRLDLTKYGMEVMRLALSKGKLVGALVV